jgi:hypothetical protein
MLVFHNDSDTSYANYAGNLSSMSSATTAVTLRFLGQGAAVTATSTDAIVLTVTAGQEENVMEALAGAVAEARSGMTVVASDVSGKTTYLHPGITAVSSISVDSGAGTFKNVVVGAFSSNDITLTTAQSGSLVTIPTTGAASTITLPTTPPDGTNYHLMCEANNGAHEIEIAGDFEGIVLDNTHATTLDNTTDITIGQSDFKAGDWLELTYRATATSWHVIGAGITDDWITAS